MTAAESSAATCSCGYTTDHHFVSGRLKYDLKGWFWIIVGVNAMPTRIEYVCRHCGEILGSTTDPAKLEAERMGGK